MIKNLNTLLDFIKPMLQFSIAFILNYIRWGGEYTMFLKLRTFNGFTLGGPAVKESGVSALYWKRAKPILSAPQILYNLISVPQH